MLSEALLDANSAFGPIAQLFLFGGEAAFEKAMLTSFSYGRAVGEVSDVHKTHTEHSAPVCTLQAAGS